MSSSIVVMALEVDQAWKAEQAYLRGIAQEAAERAASMASKAVWPSDPEAVHYVAVLSDLVRTLGEWGRDMPLGHMERGTRQDLEGILEAIAAQHRFTKRYVERLCEQENLTRFQVV